MIGSAFAAASNIDVRINEAFSFFFLGGVLVGAYAWIFVVLALLRVGIRRMAGFQQVVVLPVERVLIYRQGQFERVLEPGEYQLRSKNLQVMKVDMRPDLFRFVQSVVTSDNRPCVLTCVVRFQVSDPRLATEGFQNYKNEAFTRTESAIKKAAGQTKLDELLRHAEGFALTTKELAASALAECGCRCLSAELVQADTQKADAGTAGLMH